MVSREESERRKDPVPLEPTYASNSLPTSPLDALSAARWTLNLTTMSRLSETGQPVIRIAI